MRVQLVRHPLQEWVKHVPRVLLAPLQTQGVPRAMSVQRATTARLWMTALAAVNVQLVGTRLDQVMAMKPWCVTSQVLANALQRMARAVVLMQALYTHLIVRMEHTMITTLTLYLCVLMWIMETSVQPMA